MRSHSTRWSAEAHRRRPAPPVDEVIRRLGGRALMTRLRAEPDPEQRYPAAVARLRALMDEASPDSHPPETLEDGIDRLLGRVGALYVRRHAVAPIASPPHPALHQGPRVFARLHRGTGGFPDFPVTRDQGESPAEIEEARRLVYVG